MGCQKFASQQELLTLVLAFLLAEGAMLRLQALQMWVKGES
jgi:hypothetical protein